jgi:hypothetical protein
MGFEIMPGTVAPKQKAAPQEKSFAQPAPADSTGG